MGYNADPRLGNIWSCMKQRCNNPKHTAAKWYHDKGIRVCPEWNDNFEAFQKWAHENGYTDSLTIDRINPDLNYCPDNCRWVTAKENSSKAFTNTDNGVRRKPTAIPSKPPKRETMGRKYTQFGIDVKVALLKIGKPQKWLEEQVAEKAGLYMDSSYMYRILTGQRCPEKIVSAIKEILGMEGDA